jgi:hypothetical protein
MFISTSIAVRLSLMLTKFCILRGKLRKKCFGQFYLAYMSLTNVLNIFSKKRKKKRNYLSQDKDTKSN